VCVYPYDKSVGVCACRVHVQGVEPEGRSWHSWTPCTSTDFLLYGGFSQSEQVLGTDEPYSFVTFPCLLRWSSVEIVFVCRLSSVCRVINTCTNVRVCVCLQVTVGCLAQSACRGRSMPALPKPVLDSGTRPVSWAPVMWPCLAAAVITFSRGPCPMYVPWYTKHGSFLQVGLIKLDGLS
jgi:hypothetical protein